MDKDKLANSLGISGLILLFGIPYFILAINALRIDPITSIVLFGVIAFFVVLTLGGGKK
jgi:hypothetical protein